LSDDRYEPTPQTPIGSKVVLPVAQVNATFTDGNGIPKRLLQQTRHFNTLLPEEQGAAAVYRTQSLQGQFLDGVIELVGNKASTTQRSSSQVSEKPAVLNKLCALVSGQHYHTLLRGSKNGVIHSTTEYNPNAFCNPINGSTGQTRRTLTWVDKHTSFNPKQDGLKTRLDLHWDVFGPAGGQKSTINPNTIFVKRYPNEEYQLVPLDSSRPISANFNPLYFLDPVGLKNDGVLRIKRDQPFRLERTK
jgi:hypothetical protein